MKRPRLVSIVLVGLLSIFVSACGGTKYGSKPPQTSSGSLTINITRASGVVWGSVKSNVSSTACSSTSCTYKVSKGSSVRLTETPTDSGTWPFAGWTLNGRSKGTSPTITFKMPGSATVVVDYVLHA